MKVDYKKLCESYESIIDQKNEQLVKLDDEIRGIRKGHLCRALNNSNLEFDILGLKIDRIVLLVVIGCLTLLNIVALF